MFDIGETLLSPIRNHPKLKLVVVMVFVPLVLNAINFWIIDNILKLDVNTCPEKMPLKEIYEGNFSEPGQIEAVGPRSMKSSKEIDQKDLERDIDQKFEVENKNKMTEDQNKSLSDDKFHTYSKDTSIDNNNDKRNVIVK